MTHSVKRMMVIALMLLASGLFTSGKTVWAERGEQTVSQTFRIRGNGTVKLTGPDGTEHVLDSGEKKLTMETGTYVRLEAEATVDGVMMDGFSENPNGRSIRVSVSTAQNSVSLYLLDKKLNMLGKMENFIPDTNVSSVWYHGYFAHYLDASGKFICSVDCSMPKSPEFLNQTPQDMGDFGEYYEFGSQVLKVTPVYDETGVQTGLQLIMYRDRTPVGFEELHSVTLEGPVSLLGWDDPASLYLDEENGLIGFSVVDYGAETPIRYVLYSYDSRNGFVKLLDQPMETDGSQYLDYRTGIFDGETFYLAAPDRMLSFDMAQLKAQAE